MKEKSDGNDFVCGIELFNAGRYFESHEVLEKVWLQAEGEEKTVLQGLIQAAAALLHLERGNLVGARSLMRKSRERLAPIYWTIVSRVFQGTGDVYLSSRKRRPIDGAPGSSLDCLERDILVVHRRRAHIGAHTHAAAVIHRSGTPAEKLDRLGNNLGG